MPVITNDPELLALFAPLDARYRVAREALARGVMLAEKLAAKRAMASIESEYRTIARRHLLTVTLNA